MINGILYFLCYKSPQILSQFRINCVGCFMRHIMQFDYYTITLQVMKAVINRKSLPINLSILIIQFVIPIYLIPYCITHWIYVMFFRVNIQMKNLYNRLISFIQCSITTSQHTCCCLLYKINTYTISNLRSGE